MFYVLLVFYSTIWLNITHQFLKNRYFYKIIEGFKNSWLPLKNVKFTELLFELCNRDIDIFRETELLVFRFYPRHSARDPSED